MVPGGNRPTHFVYLSSYYCSHCTMIYKVELTAHMSTSSRYSDMVEILMTLAVINDAMKNDAMNDVMNDVMTQ